MSAELIVAGARKWLGTKWRHRGRSEFGIDCIGLVVLSVANAGIKMRDRLDYSRDPFRDGLRREIREHFGEPVSDMRAGDIVLMRWDKDERPAHVGIVADYLYGGLSLIHSYSLVAVCEHRIDDEWQKRILEVYRPWA